MARPLKTEEPLTEIKTFRLGELESLQLDETIEAERLNLADLVRVHILKRKPRGKHQPKATGNRLKLIEIVGEQGRIGNNLNQIARACNSGYEPERSAIWLALTELARVNEAILKELDP